jgi:hypothetical protein
VWVFRLGEVTNGNYQIVINGKTIVDEPVAGLKASWSGALEEQLAGEVVTAGAIFCFRKSWWPDESLQQQIPPLRCGMTTKEQATTRA